MTRELEDLRAGEAALDEVVTSVVAEHESHIGALGTASGDGDWAGVAAVTERLKATTEKLRAILTPLS